MRDMRQAFGATVTDLLEQDPRVAVVLAEISTSYFERAMAAHPDRVVDVGIMEQTMVGVAAGFAMEGFHPIAHSLSPFMAERPYEQLKLDFGYQGLGGTFVGVGGSYDYASSGGTHHSPADAGVMLGIPGMEVLIPGHGDEVDQLLRSSYANGRPTYVRASMTTNAEAHEAGPGRIEVLRRGADATVVAFGPMLDRTVAACEGLDVTIAYTTSLRPFERRRAGRDRGRGAGDGHRRAVLRGDGRAGGDGRARRPADAVRLDRRAEGLHPRLWLAAGPRRRRRPGRRRDPAVGAADVDALDVSNPYVKRIATIRGAYDACVDAGQILREARLRAGLTQRRLAQLAGVSQPTIARVESAEIQPTFDRLLQLVRACGLDLDVRVVPLDEDAWTLVERGAASTPDERLDRAIAGAALRAEGRSRDADG